MGCAAFVRVKLPVIIFACVAGAGAGGCARWDVTRVARFEPARAAADVQRPAPQSAVYRVKYASTTGRDLRTLGGTRRVISEGTPLGFARETDGAVVALAGGERIALDNLPPAARYCVWTCKERRPTQFTREVGKAATAAGGAALVGGLVVGAVALEMATHLPPRDEDCDDDRRRRRRRAKGYRWVGPEATQAPGKR